MIRIDGTICIKYVYFGRKHRHDRIKLNDIIKIDYYIGILVVSVFNFNLITGFNYC